MRTDICFFCQTTHSPNIWSILHLESTERNGNGMTAIGLALNWKERSNGWIENTEQGKHPSKPKTWPVRNVFNERLTRFDKSHRGFILVGVVEGKIEGIVLKNCAVSVHSSIDWMKITNCVTSQLFSVLLCNFHMLCQCQDAFRFKDLFLKGTAAWHNMQLII